MFIPAGRPIFKRLQNSATPMLSPETLLTFKVIGVGVAAAAQSGKMLRVAGYNKKRGDERIQLKLLFPYSAVEIEGSYDASRKKVMRFANSMTVLFYLALVMLLMTVLYPKIAASLNLV